MKPKSLPRQDHIFEWRGGKIRSFVIFCILQVLKWFRLRGAWTISPECEVIRESETQSRKTEGPWTWICLQEQKLQSPTGNPSFPRLSLHLHLGVGPVARGSWGPQVTRFLLSSRACCSHYLVAWVSHFPGILSSGMCIDICSRVPAPFCIPTSSARGFPFLRILANICCFLTCPF